MLSVCYAAKGGSGTSVTAAALALTTPGSLLVDLDGDALDVLGLPCGGRTGVSDWLSSAAEPDALDDLVVEASTSCGVLPAGDRSDLAGVAPDRLAQLCDWLSSREVPVVVDAGTGDPPPSMVERADEVLLVTRACYLALRRAHASASRPTGVVLLREPGRALTPRDVSATLGAPIVAEIQLDPAIARAVDAGLLVAALPRGLQRAVRRLAA
jgi:MinD superfamily P-loop ATPase